MKRVLIIIALFACALKAQAQGTFQFSTSGANEVPPNNDPTVASGWFILDGNVLNFQVDVPAITFIAQNAYIQGPALPGANGPIIFDLGFPVFHSGSPDFGIPPSFGFFSPSIPPFGAGPFTLTDSQINDLESGLWYLNVTSGPVPDGQIRGQIVSVPEPSLISFLGLGIVAWLFGRSRKSL